MAKVWIVQREGQLVGVYSSKPSVDFVRGLLEDHYEYLTDSDVKRLIETGWATDGWVEWSITETDLIEATGKVETEDTFEYVD